MSHAFFCASCISTFRYYVVFWKKRLSKEEAGASSFSLRWQAVAIVAFLHIHVSPLAVFNTLSVARGACSRARPTAIQLWRQASMNSTRQNK